MKELCKEQHRFQLSEGQVTALLQEKEKFRKGCCLKGLINLSLTEEAQVL